MSLNLPTQWTNNTNAIGKDLNLVEKQNASITSDLNMNSKKITNLASLSSDSDAVSKKYLHDNFLNTISDSIMQNKLNMRLNSITNVKTPTSDGDDVNKKFCDDTYLKLAGGTITGSLDIPSDIDMNGKQLNDLAAPTGDYDACIKKYVDDEVAKKLHLDGSTTMTDNLNMGGNKITNLKLATSNNDATSKVYVESNYLNKSTGGKVNGYIDVMQHKILNVKAPTANLDATNKQFCDQNYLRVSGNTMTGNINMNNNKITGLPTPSNDNEAVHRAYLTSYVAKYIHEHFSESLLWNYYTSYGICLYRIFRANTSELTYDSTTRKVSKLFDQTLSQLDATSSTTTGINKPKLCSKANKINKRYYLEFSGNKELLISDIDLNITDSTKNKVHVFIVYMLKSFNANTYWTRNDLFGHDNSGYDKFVSFWSDGRLIVSSTTGNYITVKKQIIKQKQNQMN